MIDTWEPGDPLHDRAGVYVRPIFELIDQSDVTGWSIDAARWPVPRAMHDIGEDV